jgi:hypothetical protein
VPFGNELPGLWLGLKVDKLQLSEAVGGVQLTGCVQPVPEISTIWLDGQPAITGEVMSDGHVFIVAQKSPPEQADPLSEQSDELT